MNEGRVLSNFKFSSLCIVVGENRAFMDDFCGLLSTDADVYSWALVRSLLWSIASRIGL